jgi:hypothetical protein
LALSGKHSEPKGEESLRAFRIFASARSLAKTELGNPSKVSDVVIKLTKHPLAGGSEPEFLAALGIKTKSFG